MQILNNQKSNWIYIGKIAFVASIGGFLFGYDLVVIAGALPYLVEHFNLTASMKGFAVSSAILGAIAGPLFGLWFSEKIGRRKTMMIAAVLFMISAIGSALAVTIWDFSGWRFLGGIGIGLAMISSPIYIAELSPPRLRGPLVNVNQLANVIGINLSVVVCFYFSFQDPGWRWMFGMEALPIAILLAGLLVIPESPRWLASHGRIKESLKVLTKINGREKADQELKEINNELKQKSGKFSELLKPGLRTALFIGVIIMIYSQINGVNMMLLYGPTILLEAGINIGSGAILTSIPIYVFIFICTVTAFGLIKKYSRRRLLITSISFMALSHLIMVISLYLEWSAVYILIPILIGTGAFTLGFAPLSWIIVSEIFPNKIRSKALSVVCFFLYASSFATTQLFPMLTDWFNTKFENSSGVYLIFAAICYSAVIFSWKMVPETKELSLEKICEFWQNNKLSQTKKQNDGKPKNS